MLLSESFCCFCCDNSGYRFLYNGLLQIMNSLLCTYRHPPLGVSLGFCFFFSCLLIGCCYVGSSEISISLLSASLNSLGLTLGSKYYEILISYDDILLSESSVVCQNATEIQDIDFCIMVCLNS